MRGRCKHSRQKGTKVKTLARKAFSDGSWLVGVAVIALVVLIHSTPTEAGYPQFPASLYMTDVTPVADGVRVELDWDGIQVGWFWNGATALADFTIAEYKRQSGKPWPYEKRSRNSVAREIWAHCWNVTTPLWERTFPINIGFNEWMWD